MRRRIIIEETEFNSRKPLVIVSILLPSPAKIRHVQYLPKAGYAVLRVCAEVEENEDYDLRPRVKKARHDLLLVAPMTTFELPVNSHFVGLVSDENYTTCYVYELADVGTCQKCGSPLTGTQDDACPGNDRAIGFCSDQTCPFNDKVQS